MNYDMVRVNNLSMKSVKFSNIAAKVCDYPFVSDRKVHGLIGADVMSMAVWQIDYEKKQIILTDTIKKLEFSSDTLALNCRISQYLAYPSLSANFNGIDLNDMGIAIDLGSSFGVVLPTKKAEEIIAKCPGIKYTETDDSKFVSLGEKVKSKKGYNIVVDSMKLGGNKHIFKNTSIESKKRGLTKLIGNAFLKD